MSSSSSVVAAMLAVASVGLRRSGVRPAMHRLWACRGFVGGGPRGGPRGARVKAKKEGAGPEGWEEVYRLIRERRSKCECVC